MVHIWIEVIDYAHLELVEVDIDNKWITPTLDAWK